MAPSFYQLFLVTSLWAAMYGVSPPSAPSAGGLPASQVAASNTAFALRLYRRLALGAPGENVFFSPVSVSAALAMLSLGARAATRRQLLRGLGFDPARLPEAAVQQGFQRLVGALGAPRAGLALRMGSAVFVSKELPLRAGFRDGARRLYGAQVSSVDLSSSSAARRRINSLVEKETQGKVVDLIRDLEPQAAMVLVNYIFFDAQWEKPFNPAYTSNMYPFVVGRTTVRVPMMHQVEQFAFGEDPELNCSVLQMDYRGGAAALFVLPRPGGMRQLEQALSAATLAKWSRLLRKRWIEVFIPKFSTSTSYDLETVLPKMGIQDAFDQNADFSGIAKKGFLKVSKVAHQAVVEVSEAGTKAAAATATQLTTRSKDSSPRTVCFNRPFLLLIASRAAQTTLFLGKVQDPTRFPAGRGLPRRTHKQAT
ncbi:serpin A9-like [Pipistrellus kuhlii]|nr:serpin A9-like [Pipistrellus kuhlii]